MIKIYGSPLSRASRTMWVLEELGLPYETVPLSFQKGEHKQPAFLAINPAGKMPALVDGDVVMSESLAMNLYVAQVYGKGKLWPADAPGQAKVLQWTLWAGTELEPVAYGMLREVAFKKPEERDPAVIAKLGESAKPLMALLAGVLADRAHLLGAAFSLADLQVACVLDYCTRSEFALAPWPAVTAWHAACQARPAYRRMQDHRTAAMQAVGT